MRTPTDKELCHERLGERFRKALSLYDTQRRVEVLVDQLLPGDLRGLRTLDVGCGLGFFSRRLHERGAAVTACDIGATLVERTVASVGCAGQVADALDLGATFAPGSFDLVVSSECIEHTPDPARALREMAAMLKPGGLLAVSTPNVLWWPVVRAATLLRLRPFDGHERFSTFRGMRRVLATSGVQVEQEVGVHLWPFQLPLHRLSRWTDGHAQPLRGLMINLCVLGRKQGPAPV